MKSILDPTFRYTASFNTDLKKTFAQFHRERTLASERASVASVATFEKVTSIARKAPMAR